MSARGLASFRRHDVDVGLRTPASNRSGHIARAVRRDHEHTVEHRSVQVVRKVEAELLREKVASGIGDVAGA
ncbi:MAG: hypothetical protein WKF58_01955 [Ilumatobacteraceae bacterium]